MQEREDEIKNRKRDKAFKKGLRRKFKAKTEKNK